MRKFENEKCIVHYDVIRTKEGSKTFVHGITISSKYRHKGLLRLIFNKLYEAWGPVEFECMPKLKKMYEHVGCKCLSYERGGLSRYVFEKA